ncbi:MAG: hypothetical protein ABSB12_00500 [Candidatus Saccharimonadales bacterium]|jgi:hypothetical protein
MIDLRRRTILDFLGGGLLIILVGLALLSTNWLSNPSKAKIFTDVSWPNCDKTVDSNYAEYGIVGVSGGLDYHLNPCLTTETNWFTHYGLYVNTGYPGLAETKKLSLGPNACTNDDYLCFAYNYGFQATAYDIHYADQLGLASPLWMLDVETDNSWTNNPLLNQASLQGAIDAIKQLIFSPKIGIYSTPSQWAIITDNWRPTIPAWLGTGDTTLTAAINACHTPSFTAGEIWFTQYTPYLDEDYTCQTIPMWTIGE